ncbi:MAG: hypothetical protein WKH64_02370 [Chloroflexia bacterium]
MDTDERGFDMLGAGPSTGGVCGLSCRTSRGYNGRRVSMPSETQGPNVVVFFTDQQRWDTTGVHGNPLELAFDRMANMEPTSTTRSPQPYAVRPVVPADRHVRHHHRLWRNGIPLPPDARTLHYFGEGGLHTGYIGKWHLAGQDPVPRSQRGGYGY